MTLYKNFIGIDIGKCTFVVGSHNQTTTKEYKNEAKDIARFIEGNRAILSDSLCVLETTGGYELELAYRLIESGFKVHRADTRKVKSFIRSYGASAKTDALDAKALAKYGFERHEQLALFEKQSERSAKLFQLLQRRNDLTAILVAEKNRLQKARDGVVKASIEQLISLVKAQIDSITTQIKGEIKSDARLQRKLEELKTTPGIGDVVAFQLLILLPELGSLSRGKISSLAGVAPRANESGKFFGYRRTGCGRGGIKSVLFIAAMSARNSKTRFKEFYEQLVGRGKRKKVALTALMRKILVVTNAKLKALQVSEQLQSVA